MLDLFSRKEFIIFTTRDYAAATGLTLSAASKMLARLKEKKLLERVTKGVWANIGHPYFHPLSCTPFLLNREQGYVSFLTALHLHGLLSQIPVTIQVASTGHSRKLHSPVGTFEFLQIKPELMLQGVEWSDTQLPFLLATPEKALLDILYISTRKNRRFSSLPELSFGESEFSHRKLKLLIRELPLPPRLRSAITARIAKDTGFPHAPE